MKKVILFLSMLWLPFLANAQWSIQFTTAGGPLLDMEREVSQNLYSLNKVYGDLYGHVGYSLQAGIDVQYFISPGIGVGTGIAYQYIKIDGDPMFRDFVTNEFFYNDSRSIMIPLSFLWSPGKHHRSVLSFGFVSHINLIHDENFSNTSMETYPFYSDVRLGYSYRFGNRFEAGIFFSRTLGWYSRTNYYYYYIPGADISTGYASRVTYYDRYFTSAQLSVSYRLFGRKKK